MRWVLALSAAVVAVVLAVVLLRSDEPGTLDFAVTTGVDLGLTADDQLVHSFSTGVWRGAGEGSLLTIRESHLFGDEGGESTTITLRLSGDTPVVIRAYWQSSDADGGDEERDYRTGSLELQSADADAIVA
ncbi:MAG: hypothetical protein HKO87_02545, partial [Acidimicrobiia bacterium]|nr:hypothetical protein [Acidimicrobiia bacterium]